MRPLRLIQGLCLLVFAGLTLSTALTGDLTVRPFVALDPIIFITSLLGTRELPIHWLAPLLILVCTPFLGRFFCTTLCPLGTLIDLTDRLQGNNLPLPRHTGSILLVFILLAALCGLNPAWLMAPLALATRLLALIVAPLALLSADSTLGLGQRLLQMPPSSLPTPGFNHPWIILALSSVPLLLSFLGRRTWCRCFCPAGALLGLLSSRPLLRRRVNAACISCGACRNACPMDAIDDDPFQTRFSSCSACGICRDVCPTDAISFTTSGLATPTVLPRRALLLSAIAGPFAAALSRAAPQPPPPRPPGALPEPDFLRRCVRCGACLLACPTAALQPTLSPGILSPILSPLNGPCEPRCTACGDACPTGALLPLHPDEKIACKLGTAHINRSLCLAWEYGQECLVCDEVCPYDAISLQPHPDSPAAVPTVAEHRCAGCGYCEHHCPTGPRAITVDGNGALRLSTPDYRRTAQARGLDLRLAADKPPPSATLPPDQLPPGFTE